MGETLSQHQELRAYCTKLADLCVPEPANGVEHDRLTRKIWQALRPASTVSNEVES